VWVYGVRACVARVCVTVRELVVCVRMGVYRYEYGCVLCVSECIRVLVRGRGGCVLGHSDTPPTAISDAPMLYPLRLTLPTPDLTHA